MKVKDFLDVVKLDRTYHEHISFFNEDGSKDYDTFYLDENNNYINHQKGVEDIWGWLGQDIEYYLNCEVLEITGSYYLKIRF